MQIVFFDDALVSQLYPFTRTRSAADIRCGILTVRARWEQMLRQTHSGTLTSAALQPVYGQPEQEGERLYINSRLLATRTLVEAFSNLNEGEWITDGSGILLAIKRSGFTGHAPTLFEEMPPSGEPQVFASKVTLLTRIWDIFSLNGEWIRNDFELLTQGRLSTLLPAGVIAKKNENIFLEEGAKIGLGVLLNAGDGPIYIGRNAEVMDGAMIKGPMALGENATVKMGAKVYGDTTIGPGCKVGGEVSNAVFFANSNKGHDGFVGNCVIGEWCNLGADTNASNLKNNYDGIKIHDDATGKRLTTGLTFCGLMMGDHSKCGINTMFNTGTVVGVSCNIYGGEFPPSYIPSFSWGGAVGFKTYLPEKAIETANRMMARRNTTLTEAEKQVLSGIFEETAPQRKTEHAKLNSASE